MRKKKAAAAKKKKPVRKKAKPRSRKKSSSDAIREQLDLHEKMETLHAQIANLWDYIEKSEERIQDLEIHMNLLTRLFTTLCIEKFGMRVGVLKRFIKRVESEAIRDSQISHLESLYQMDHPGYKKRRQRSKKEPPWDDIS